jgi:hypothetical protein
VTREAIDAAINRRVTPDEIRHALTGPIGAEERDEVLALVRWFTTRYPTPEARLAYVRRAYARWRSSSGR